MNPIKQHSLASKEDLALALALDTAKILSAAIEKNNRASLVVSGGSTPVPFFQALALQPIKWSKVTVCLADERCVASNHADRNANLVKQNLLTGLAEQAHFIDLFDDSLLVQGSSESGLQVDASAEKYAESALAHLGQYDVVILGMGGDGHSASIFPESPQRDRALEDNSDHLAVLADPVTVGPLRITQTKTRLLRTNHLFLHITGEQKQQLFNEINSLLKQPKIEKTWPIAAFMKQQTVALELYTEQIA